MQRSMSDLLSMRHEAVCVSSLMARFFFFFEEFGVEVGGGVAAGGGLGFYIRSLRSRVRGRCADDSPSG